jgi:hypothetical protein
MNLILQRWRLLTELRDRQIHPKIQLLKNVECLEEIFQKNLLQGVKWTIFSAKGIRQTVKL